VSIGKLVPTLLFSSPQEIGDRNEILDYMHSSSSVGTKPLVGFRLDYMHYQP
jgi:hypothetical protein